MATEKPTIDPRFYGVLSHSNRAGYDIPYIATGHLIYYPKGKVLCTGEGANLYGREKDSQGYPYRDSPHKPVWPKKCRRCQKVADELGLVEWVLPPLRKGDCPVLSERHGERAKHIMNPYRPRCADCPEPGWNKFERCKAKHETYALCNSCGYEERDRHFCDHVVGRSVGISTQFGYCDKPAKDVYQYDRHSNDKGRWGYLCAIHTPEAKARREAEFQARMRADDERWEQRRKKEHDEDDAFDLLVEFARWTAANHELAEEDEWLRTLAGRVAKNDLVLEALAQPPQKGQRS